MHKLLRIFLWSLIFIVSPLWAQRTCGTEKLDSIRRGKNPKLETIGAFEQWMGNQILRKQSGANRTQSTYNIPVVVHIIHNGQALGNGSNITDAQIISQINVLNKDFQRLNTDAANTPAEFQDEAASLSVQFVLAKQDPSGNATTGIVRVNGGKTNWEIYQDTELKSKSYWPTEHYFNIWVTSIPSYLGYSSFPVSGLAGLENSSENRLVDGVVIHHRSFGSLDDGAFDLDTQFNKGRTLTHETGHFLGLRHIWGDGSSCSATDFVTDTPPQINNSSGCPIHPKVECSGLAKMFQNYMDYTDDNCMNLFTAGQFSRVEAVIQNSIRRASLLTSPGAYPPGNFVLDLGITTINEPTTLECSGSHTPTLIIRNFGITPITQATIKMQRDGNLIQTITPALSLGALQETTVSFNAYTSISGESHQYSFTILSVNGLTDEYSGNNSFSVTTNTAHETTLPFIETFENSLSNWDVLNPDGLITWDQRNMASAGKALYANNFNYENIGETDKIFSPLIHTSLATGLLLKFKYAHAHASGYDGDALAVYALNGCTDDIANATPVFNKANTSLATTGNSSTDFIPTSSGWKTEYISLNSFLGSSTLRLAFVAGNGYGNNIYIDSVQLLGNALTDLAIQQVLEPSWAVCESPVTPKIAVNNQGTTSVNGFSITVYRNGLTLATQTFTSTIDPGEGSEITLNPLHLIAGANKITFSVAPANLTDEVPTNNEVEWPMRVITNSASIPNRQNFDLSNDWVTVSGGSTDWVLTNTNYDQSAFFIGFENTNLNDESWLVSPKLDFSSAMEASLFADFSYAQNGNQQDEVILSASTNCGLTFDHTLFQGEASSLTNSFSNSEWTPNSKEDWFRKYINLNDFTGLNNVLIAIRAINQNGNNLYLDNIEFFENDNPDPPEISKRFSVYSNNSLSQTYLTFNLTERQPAEIIVSNIMGASIANVALDNALNQTLTFQLNVVPGIYIFKVRIGQVWSVVRYYIGD